MKDGSKSVSGFEALKELDDNEDGVINSKDAAFGNFGMDRCQPQWKIGIRRSEVPKRNRCYIY